MFGKKRKYPKLTVADEMIIETMKREDDASSKAFDRYRDTQTCSEPVHAQAKAEWLFANERAKKSKAAYDEMMRRLVAEARATLEDQSQ